MRRLLALLCSIIFVDAMLYTALTPLVPGYAEEFELSKTGAGLLVAAFGAGALLGGIPGGLAAARFGPKTAVVWGLVLLGVASFAFAIAGSVVALGIARFVQGFSSTVTWAGALAWVAGVAPKEKRGEMIGIAFGAAIAGAILGPMFGGVAETVGIRVSLTTLGIVAFVFALLAFVERSTPGERLTADGVRRAFRDIRFLGGLWLNTLPAMLFGILVLLAPLALDDAGWSTLGIAAVFFLAGVVEVVINPFLGRASDRLGRLLPIRFALAGSTAVAVVLAASSEPVADRDPHRRRRNHLREPVHTRDGADLASRGRGGPCARPRLRDHEHGLGARRAPRAVARRCARRSLRATQLRISSARVSAAHARRDVSRRSREDARHVKRDHWDRKYAETEQLWAIAPNRSFAAEPQTSHQVGRSTSLRGRPARGVARRARLGGYGGRLLRRGDREEHGACREGQVEVDFRCADLLDFVPEREAFDLVLVLFLQLPGDERRLVLPRATAAIAPGGTFFLVGHDLENLDKGFGGPSDPDLLYTPEDIVAELPGSRSRRRSGCCATVDGADRPAIDALSEHVVLPRRPPHRTAPPRAASGRRRTAPPCRRRPACLPAGRRPRAARR